MSSVEGLRPKATSRAVLPVGRRPPDGRGPTAPACRYRSSPLGNQPATSDTTSASSRSSSPSARDRSQPWDQQVGQQLPDVLSAGTSPNDRWVIAERSASATAAVACAAASSCAAIGRRRRSRSPDSSSPTSAIVRPGQQRDHPPVLAPPRARRELARSSRRRAWAGASRSRRPRARPYRSPRWHGRTGPWSRSVAAAVPDGDGVVVTAASDDRLDADRSRRRAAQ